MNVLHVNTERSWRGGEQQLAYLIKGSAVYGITNFVFCRSSSAISGYCTKNDIPHFTLPSIFFNTFLAAFYLHYIARRHNITLIHAHSSKAHSLAILANLTGKKINVVVSRRVIFQPKRSLWTMFRYNHPTVKKIICISNAVRDSLLPVVKDASKFEIIFSGIDIERVRISPRADIRKELRLDKDAVIIGNISALNSEKDLFTFIDTASILLKKHSHLHFIVLGEGPLRQDLETYAAKNQLNEKLLFTGFKKDVVTWLKGFDIFLFTSKAEGLGTSLLDAFAAGIPVVATNAGGIGEVLIDEKTGLLAEPGDSLKLADAVDRILKDEALKQKLIENANDHLANFSWDRMAEQTAKLYSTLDISFSE